MGWGFIGKIYEVGGQGSYFLQCLLSFGLFSKFYDKLRGMTIFAIKLAGLPQVKRSFFQTSSCCNHVLYN